MKKHKRKWFVVLWICITVALISSLVYLFWADRIFLFNYDRDDLAGVKILTPTGAYIIVNRVDDCAVITEYLSSLTLHRKSDYQEGQAFEFMYRLTLYKKGGGILVDFLVLSPHDALINGREYEVTSGSFDLDYLESLFEKYEVNY